MMMEANKPEEEKARLHLEVEQLPEIEKWEVGEKYKVLVEMQMVSKREALEMDDSESESEMCAEFMINKIKVLPVESNFSKDDIKVAINMDKTSYAR